MPTISIYILRISKCLLRETGQILTSQDPDGSLRDSWHLGLTTRRYFGFIILIPTHYFKFLIRNRV